MFPFDESVAHRALNVAQGNAWLRDMFMDEGTHKELESIIEDHCKPPGLPKRHYFEHLNHKPWPKIVGMTPPGDEDIFWTMWDQVVDLTMPFVLAKSEEHYDEIKLRIYEEKKKQRAAGDAWLRETGQASLIPILRRLS